MKNVNETVVKESGKVLGGVGETKEKVLKTIDETSVKDSKKVELEVNK